LSAFRNYEGILVDRQEVKGFALCYYLDMETYEKMRQDLITNASRVHKLSPPVIEAFYRYPRHEFVPAKYSKEEAYLDTALNLYQEGPVHSTISQPSFVLYLLELLKVEKGQKIFELGTGSGWNAALMSYLTGSSGKVFTLEIIPDIGRSAQAVLKKFKISNVEVIIADASHGWAAEAPYDRMIFTAASPVRPAFLLEQCKDGGRVLFVQKDVQGRDELQVLEKHGDQFTCLQKVPCYFVAMTGEAGDVSSKPKSRPRHNQ
jgi:protein-L-isoaspartate(D-aspartate) O-methyltransferase